MNEPSGTAPRGELLKGTRPLILDVRELQCSQAVMALLRQLVRTPPGGLIEIWWQEPDAHRDMLTVLERQGHQVIQEWKSEQYHALLIAKCAP